MANEEEAVQRLMRQIREELPAVADAIEARFAEGKVVPFEALPEEERTRRTDAVKEALKDSKAPASVGRPRKADLTRVELTSAERLDMVTQFVRSMGHSMLAARESLRSLAGDPEILKALFVEPERIEGQELPETTEPGADEVHVAPTSPHEAALREALAELDVRLGTEG